MGVACACQIPPLLIKPELSFNSTDDHEPVYLGISSFQLRTRNRVSALVKCLPLYQRGSLVMTQFSVTWVICQRFEGQSKEDGHSLVPSHGGTGRSSLAGPLSQAL